MVEAEAGKLEEVKMKIEDVKKMTKDKLRIKAEILGGWSELEGVGKYPRGLPPCWSEGTRPKCDVPDYPNDIAAAWELIDDLLDRCDNQISIEIYYDLRNEWTCSVYCSECWIDLEDKKPARAITMAYIVARDRLEADQTVE